MKLTRKLSPVVVEGAKAGVDPYRLWDSTVPQLFVRVQPSGIKSFNVQWSRTSSRSLGKWPGLTVEAARRKARDALVETNQHGAPIAVVEASDPAPANVYTVTEACRDYVAALVKDGRADAGRDAERRFERTVYGDVLGGIKLCELTQDAIEQWRDRVETGDLPALAATKGRSPTPKPLTKATVNRMRSTLVAALNRAVARRKVSAERAFEWKNVRPYSGVAQRRELYLDLDQRRALLSHTGAELRDVMTCILLTGCRPGDPAAMLRNDYDSRAGNATFRTKGHTRTVPLTLTARQLFDRLAKGKPGTAYLFTNGTKRWRARDWSRMVTDAAVGAGLPGETVLYTLRHCWITDAITGGLDLLTVTKLAGTSLTMVEKHYGHLVQGAARDKLSQLAFL